MKRSSFNVLFFLKKTKLLKNGEASVCSQAKESARGKSRKSCDLNAYIENAKIKLHQIFNELEEEQQPHQRPREPVERKPPAPQHPSRPEAEAHRSLVVKISIHIAAAKVRLSLRPAGFPHTLSPSGPQDLPTPLPSAVIPGTQKPSPCPRRPPAATISTNRATAGHERTVGTPPRRLTFLPSSSLFPQRHQKTSEQKWTFSHRVNT